MIDIDVKDLPPPFSAAFEPMEAARAQLNASVAAAAKKDNPEAEEQAVKTEEPITKAKVP